MDEVVDGKFICPVLPLSREEEAHIRNPWKCYLIIKLLRRHIGFRLLEKKLRQLWREIGAFDIMDLGYHYYLIKSLQEKLLLMTTKVVTKS